MAEGLPRCLVVDGKSAGAEVVESVALPATPAEVVALVQKWSE
jgi:hypothetical protein